MTIALRGLPMGEEALRRQEMQIVLCPRHSDVEQPALFLDFSPCSRAEIGRNAAVDDIEDKHRFPFLPFGGMDGGKDQIVLVEVRRASLIAGRIRRIERQLGQEALTRGIAGRDLFELQKVGLPDGGVVVDAVEMGLVPAARLRDLRWPSGLAGAKA